MPIERTKGSHQGKHPHHTEKTHINENKRFKIYIKMKDTTPTKHTAKGESKQQHHKHHANHSHNTAGALHTKKQSFLKTIKNCTQHSIITPKN